ncbi:Peroxidasin [Carabus blaptoides fortunei]
MLQLEKIPKINNQSAILDLRFNRIHEIPPGTFKGLKHLNTLLLNNNQLTALKDGAFAGLTNLRYLYLYKNHISYLDPNVFQGLPKLEQLYLHFNEIREFDARTFSNLPSLDRLFLHNNRLQRVQPGTFTGMPKLRRLRLDSNALVCDCQMFWLAKMLNDSAIQAAANCDAPQDMYGKSLKGMSAQDFHCKIPHIMEGPQDVEVSWGGTAIFKCRVDGDPKPKIIWMRDSLELPARGDRYAIMEDGSLHIENSQDTDIGQYECMAITPDAEIKSRSARMIVTRPENIIYSGKPKFIQTPDDQVTDVGAAEVRLNCEAVGDPQPQMSWSHNGVQLGLTSRHQMESEGTLIIRNLQASDYGAYRCEAANYLGRIMANAQIKINSPPLFTVHPENLRIKTGARAVLECLAVGSPNPTITWYKSDRPIRVGGRIQIEADNSRLIINDVKESDSGLYVCQARNILGFREVSADIDVKRAVENPPRFIYQPYDIAAYPKTTIELPCRAEGDPEPDIQWRKDGTRLERNPAKYRISGSGSLYISDLAEEDSGRYECTAINEYGRATANGLVTLKQEHKAGGKIGDQFVRIAFAEASKEVDSAINKT